MHPELLHEGLSPVTANERRREEVFSSDIRRDKRDRVSVGCSFIGREDVLLWWWGKLGGLVHGAGVGYIYRVEAIPSLEKTWGIP